MQGFILHEEFILITLNFPNCHFCLFANIWFFIANQDMFTIIFTIFFGTIVRSTIFKYWGNKANVRAEYTETSHNTYVARKIWLLQSCKKTSHIVQEDVRKLCPKIVLVPILNTRLHLLLDEARMNAAFICRFEKEVSNNCWYSFVLKCRQGSNC